MSHAWTAVFLGLVVVLLVASAMFVSGSVLLGGGGSPTSGPPVGTNPSNQTSIPQAPTNLVATPLSPPPAQPTASTTVVSNSEIDLIWHESVALVGSDHATLNEYSGASCSGSGTAVDVQTGNWGFQNFTALTPATVYSFNVTITDSDGTSAASACAAATTRAQTLDPFGAVAQGNTTISLPTVAGQRIILAEGFSDALPGDSQGNSWSYVQDGNTGDDALWTAVTATTGTDVITTGTSWYFPYTGGWAVAVSGELKTIVASGQAGAGFIGSPMWAKLPAQAENTVAVFTEAVGGVQNESCQFTVPVGVPLSCTPILDGPLPGAGGYGPHPAWRFPAFVYDVPAGTAPVVSGNLTAYGNTLNGTDTGTPGRYVPVGDFFWVELAWPVPAAPTGLTATPVSSTEVDLAWTNPAVPLTGNNVTEWAGSGCTGGPLDTFAMAPGTVADWTSLAVGTTYSYSVTASNVSGVGANSACADATTFDSPPAPPSNTPPSAPSFVLQNYSATYLGGTLNVSVSWTQGAFGDGSPIVEDDLWLWSGSCGDTYGAGDWIEADTFAADVPSTNGNVALYGIPATTTLCGVVVMYNATTYGNVSAAVSGPSGHYTQSTPPPIVVPAGWVWWPLFLVVLVGALVFWFYWSRRKRHEPPRVK